MIVNHTYKKERIKDFERIPKIQKDPKVFQKISQEEEPKN